MLERLRTAAGCIMGVSAYLAALGCPWRSEPRFFVLVRKTLVSYMPLALACELERKIGCCARCGAVRLQAGQHIQFITSRNRYPISRTRRLLRHLTAFAPARRRRADRQTMADTIER